ncbi:MAG TPA: PKD domain-containing protein, partial [Thermoanaerobaculia bacterium]|nr:PKD domain-containing protein [Thermoanaerobaculia bacterium]
YAIYNPKTHIWAEGSDSAGSLSGSGGPTFVNFGVDFQMSFSTQHRRFNGSAWGPGQNSSPLAATYVNPTSGSPTLNVCLANNSVATTSYSWTFGDGGTSTSDSVQHGYTTPDLFTWNFGASGPGGGPDTATGTIKTDFAAPTNGMVSINGGASCTNTNAVNLTISAMDNSGTVTEMQISNESPGTGSWEPYATSKMWSLQNTTGTRTVWIAFKDRAGNISSNGPNDTITFDNTPAPTAGNDGPKCAGQTLALTASFISGATYAWTGPNGFTSSQQNPSISGATPAATGIYSVTATVNGCPTPAGMTMATVTTAPSTPTAGNNGPICVGQTLNLTASFVSGATYAWTGPNGFTSTQQNPSISNATAAANGMYSVTATAGGCTSSAGTTSATVNGDPTAPTVTAPAAATVTQSTCS